MEKRARHYQLMEDLKAEKPLNVPKFSKEKEKEILRGIWEKASVDDQKRPGIFRRFLKRLS